MDTAKLITLYHGSKAGIKGAIAPISRDRCDFGKGFYMGTEKAQPLTLICNYPNPILYTVQLNLTGLKVLDIEIGLQWALLVAYNRGKMDAIQNTPLYNYYANLAKGYDIIVGYIADDRMFLVLDRFFNGDITDKALVNSLSALQLGKQYVAVTEKACASITITQVKEIAENEKLHLKKLSEQNRRQGISLADEICKKYRRDGKFFDEIIEAGENYA